jgi:transposase
VAIRHNPVLKAFAERLQDRAKPKMSIVCAVMRKLLHLCYGVLKTGLAFDPNYLLQKLPKPANQLQPA